MTNLVLENELEQTEPRGVFLGRRPYHEVRVQQEALVQKRIVDEEIDTILCCEHPAIITLGRRVEDADLGQLPEGIEVISVRRGGRATYHGPGQLLIYPVIKLRDHGLGPKRFVQGMLEVIAEVVQSYGISTMVKLDSTGVWVETPQGLGKIAFAGLEIRRGVTNHGFSLNINCDINIFSRFIPCGNPNLRVTSIAECVSGVELSAEELSRQIVVGYSRWLSSLKASKRPAARQKRVTGECFRPVGINC